MEARVSREEPPLVVIIGPTASGKTSLAIKLAKRSRGEIICADSRTVYKYMDIGTAKPTPEERAQIPHWGLDLVEPGEKFTVADFKEYAENKIQEIRARGNTPFLVGGSGLYVDAVLYDYQLGPEPDMDQRRALEQMTIDQLHIYCAKNNILLPENYKNKRYVIRAIERKSSSIKRRSRPIKNTLIVGVSTERDTLRTRIRERTEQLFQNGVVDEATKLGKKYGWNNEAMTGNIYRLARSYLMEELTLQEFKDRFTTLDWQLAKRQMTWMKRRSFVKWLSLEEAEGYLSRRLAKYK